MNDDELEELYQQVVLEHARRPRNFGEMEGDAIRATGDNPSCGDEIHVHVRLGEGGRIEDLKFTGQGCAISQASASMMTMKLKGRSPAEAAEMLRAFQELVTTDTAEAPRMLGDLRLLRSVRRFPQRVKCATLAWHTLEQALAQSAAREPQ